MFRLILFTAVVLGAVLAVQADWDKENRTLILRLRNADDVVGLFREKALALGKKAVEAAAELPASEPLPAVSSGPPQPGARPGGSFPDRLTPEDQRALDRLIEKKIRESRGGAASRPN